MTQDNFCPIPFGHTMITAKGNFQVCCLHETPKEYQVNINNSLYEDWRDGQYLNIIQESFRKDLKHPGCKTCWANEKIGQISYRKRILKEYSLLNITSVDDLNDYPVNIEINLGNLCNLKCLMCAEWNSSAILAENVKLGINQFQQQEFHWTPEAFDHLEKLLSHQPKIINIRGGEPFYNKDLLKLVERLPEDTCKKSLLHITTNTTQWSSAWAQALKKFKLVRIMISLDAIDDLYEYIRYPASWNQVRSNVLEMKNYSNFKLLVHSVVQNLNILQLGKLINWCQDNNLYIHFDQLIDPDYLQICNLPHAKKQQAVDHLQHILTENHSSYINEFVQNCINQLSESLNQPDNILLWKKFKNQIGMRDTIRNNSYQKFL